MALQAGKEVLIVLLSFYMLFVANCHKYMYTDFFLMNLPHAWFNWRTKQSFEPTYFHVTKWRVWKEYHNGKASDLGTCLPVLGLNESLIKAGFQLRSLFQTTKVKLVCLFKRKNMLYIHMPFSPHSTTIYLRHKCQGFVISGCWGENWMNTALSQN